ncbi:hypothetical protein ACFIOY_22180 [Bradyrhizobium sp. TZ2]
MTIVNIDLPSQDRLPEVIDRIRTMSEPSIDHGVGMVGGLSGRRDGRRLELSTDSYEQAGREAPGRGNRPQQAPLKILFANKFFF